MKTVQIKVFGADVLKIQVAVQPAATARSGQPTPKLVVKAGEVVMVEVDGQAFKGDPKATTKVRAATLKKKGDNLLIVMDDEEIMELEGFYAQPNVSLHGDSWTYAPDAGLHAVNGNLQLAEFDSALSSSGAAESSRPVMATALSPGLKFGAGLAAVAAVAVAAGASTPDASPGAAPPNTVVTGALVAGPVIDGKELTLQIYSDAGELLGEGKVNDDGSYRVTLNQNYSGNVLVKLTDTGTGADYIDEATAQALDLSINILRAVGVVTAGEETAIYITPLTEKAVQLLLRDATGESISTRAKTASEFEQASKDALTALGFRSDAFNVFTDKPAPKIDSKGLVQISNDYGAALAALSAYEKDQDLTTQQVLTAEPITALEMAKPSLKTWVNAELRGGENSQIYEDLIKDILGITSPVPTEKLDAVLDKIVEKKSATNATVDEVFSAIEENLLELLNTPAVITGQSSGSVTEAGGVRNAQAGTVSASGNLDSTDLDPDNADDLWRAVTNPSVSTGAFGTYTVSSAGVWTYTLNNEHPAVQALATGQTLTDTFTARTADGTRQVVTITVTGSNDAPVATFSTAQNATEDGAPLSGQLTATDVDAGVTLRYALLGNPIAGLTINPNGSWTFDPKNAAYQSLANGESRSITVNYSVTDADNASDSESFTLVVTGANDAPTAVHTLASQVFSTDESNSFVIPADAFSDLDTQDTLVYSATLADGSALPAWLSFNPQTRTFRGQPTDGSQPWTIKVTASDGLASVSSEFVITPTSAPRVQSLSVTDDTAANTDKLGKEGESLTLVLTLSKPVTSSGGLTAVFTIGGVEVSANAAQITSASNTVTFTGVLIPPGANGSVSLKSLVVQSGGTMVDDRGNALLAPAENAIQDARYEADTTAPSVVITEVPDPDNASSYAAGFKVEAGDRVVVSVNGAALDDTALGDKFTKEGTGDGKDLYTAKVGAFDGTETILVNASRTDAAGNVGNATPLPLKPIDTTPSLQTVLITDDAQGQTRTSDDSTQDLIGTLSDVLALGETVVIFDGAVELGTATIDAVGLTWQFTTPELSEGLHTLTARIRDAAGNLAAAAVDNNGVTQAYRVNIDFNDAPTAISGVATAMEDIDLVLTASNFAFTDAADSPAHALSAVVISRLPSAGALKLDGADVTLNQVISKADIDAGKLVFRAAQNAHGSAYANLGFKVKDDGGTAGGGVDTSDEATLTFNVTAVNDAPTASAATLNATEDTDFVFTVPHFGFADSTDNSAHQLLNVIITALPTAGTLRLNGADVSAGQAVSRQDIQDGKLVFKAAENANGNAYATLKFKVQDDGGTDNAGRDTSPVDYELTLNVANVNDAPTTTYVGQTLTWVQGQALSFNLADFFADDEDASVDLHYELVGGSPAGTELDFYGSDGHSLTGSPTDLGRTTLVVKARDSGGLTKEVTFQIDVVGAPVLSSELAGVSNLDVRSDIVLKVTEGVKWSEGTHTFTLTDRETSGGGFRNDTNTNTQTITVVVDANGAVTSSTGGQVTIDNAHGTIRINPTFDLDLSSDYRLSVSDGAFTGLISGQAAQSFTSVDFSTVTPGVNFAAAVQAQGMTDTGELTDTLKWFDGTAMGTQGTQVTADLGGDDYAGVWRMLTLIDGFTVENDSNVLFENFGADDLIYFDIQDAELELPSGYSTVQQLLYDMGFQGGSQESGQPYDFTTAGTGIDGTNYIFLQLEDGITAGLGQLLPDVLSTGWSNTGAVLAA